MTNALYGKARAKFLNGGLNWSADTIKVLLVDAADYAVLIDTHEFLSDVLPAARVATSGVLTGKTSALGVAGAADTFFAAVTGDISEALIVFKDTGVEATSSLIAYIDTATGLPATPNGGNVNVAWSTGANLIFKL